MGQPVEIVLDALPDVRFRGQVGGIVPTVDRAKATVMTKIRFDQLDARILPEMSAKVSFLSRPITEADQRPVMAVNPQAVQTHEGARVLWRIKVEGSGEQARWTVEPVRVTVGRPLGEVTEVSPVTPGTLKAGDKVVGQPADGLRSGARVVQAKS